jgi:thiamine-phosphate diphosphorylase
VTAAIDLYVFAERNVFDTDGRWLDAIATLAHMDAPGLAVQVRTKTEPAERALALAREARAATQGALVPVLLNGSTEEALALGYEGVHWPESLIPDMPEETLVLRGASVHSVEACRRAEVAGAGFVVAGTIFDAGSKPVAGEGLEKLRGIAAATTLPVLAIGGIRPDRVAACIEAGAAGVAVVTSVLRAPDIAVAVRELREALDAAAVAASFNRAGAKAG